MDTEKAIKGRRSIREYTEKKVSHDKISEVLDSARHAPCSGNIQNCYFIVVQDIKKRAEIAKACSRQLWVEKAPVHIIICNKQDKIKTMYGDKGEKYSIQNCAMASQNLMLRAFSLGLSTCFVGSLDEIKLQRILKLPDNIKIEGIITLGYSKKEEKLPRKLGLERITYFEEWGRTVK